MKGIFTLTSPKDLFAKLRYEHELLHQDPENAYIAFNFFVTAEHLLDWLYPGNAGKSQREQLRDQEVLLQTVSHIASGAIHFVAEAKHHKSVVDSGRPSPYFSDKYFGRFFGSRYFGRGRLTLYLSGATANTLGNSITPIDLADKVLAYWEACTDLK